MSEGKTTINRKEIQTTSAKRPVSKLAPTGRKAATPRPGIAAKRTTKPGAKTGADSSGSTEIGRTTRKAPRAAAARTSKRPTTNKPTGAKVTPKRSAKKRAPKKRSTSGRGKRR